MPLVGVLAAIAATTALDLAGYFAFSALPLIPLFFFFWYLERLKPGEVGFRLGRPLYYALAILLPLLVMGAIAAAAAASGVLDTSQADLRKVLLNLALVASVSTLMALITEEGFFRGWLWGSLARRGFSNTSILLWTSLAFMAWHISPVVLETSFRLPGAQVPVFLANATLLGLAWGLLRLLSGSILVSSLCHAVWNALAYVLFGFGTRTGALGIADTAFYGPEVGLLGLALNALVVAFLWRLARTRLAASSRYSPA